MSTGEETFLILLMIAVPYALVYGFRKVQEDPDAGMDSVAYGTIFWVLAIIVCAIYSGVSRSNSPDLVTLKKDEWSCVHTHREHRMVGKVLTTVDVCDTYQSVSTENE